MLDLLSRYWQMHRKKLHL